MSVVVLLIVLAIIVFLLAKSLQEAKREQAARQGTGVPGTTARRTAPRPRVRRRKPALDQEALAAHVVKLRKAVSTGLISTDEAIDSIVRQTGGALGADAARKLLDSKDDAA